MKERKVVTKAICEQYRKAAKKEKGRILDQFVESTGYTRCYARSVLRNHGRRVEVKPGIVLEGDRRLVRQRPRAVVYESATVEALKKVWKTMDYICGKRLAAAMPQVVARLVAFKELRISKKIQRHLLSMSAATIDRLLKPERMKHMLKRRGGTKPGTLLKHQIPIRTFADWDTAQPGYIEMDLVGHDGGVGQGDFCQTLDMTDVATGWSEQAAVLNKAEKWVFEAIQLIRSRLPFPLLGLDSDNGSEFINHHLARYCNQERITFTRSRASHKNDTCYVEQKNWSIVRRFVGYARYTAQESVDMLNELYALVRDYNNFFLPSFKLKEKVRDGSRIIRRYHPAQTPYERILESSSIARAIKNKLTAHYQSLNPADLYRRIQKLQNKLGKLAVRCPAVKAPSLDGFTALVPKRRVSRDDKKRPRPSSRPLGRRSGRTPASPYPPPRSKPAYAQSKSKTKSKTSKTFE